MPCKHSTRYFLEIFALSAVLAAGAMILLPSQNAAAARRITNATAEVETSDAKGSPLNYKLNVIEKNGPLLTLAQDRLKPGFDQSLSHPGSKFDFPIFRSLGFDDERGVYLLPAISHGNSGLSFIELSRGAAGNVYTSETGIELVDRDGLKIVKTAEGTRYLFVRYPDNEFRCATIKEANGSTLNLLYTANGLVLHGLVDTTGRSVTFNYGAQGISSVTQTWMAELQGFTRTWIVGEDVPVEPPAKFAHALRGAKFMPSNALVQQYTEEMAASDKLLAAIFGGRDAVVGANGFEPPGLAASYPLYRGDIVGDDGKMRRGHLSYAMHIYGSADGRGDSPLYIPAGFVSHSNEPSPTDAAVTFYYPRLGNLTDVTLAVFHVSDFQLFPEGDRVRIGNLGGAGGSSALYKHSHIEFYRGNVGLPSPSARAALRIDPVTVFGGR